MPSGHRRSFTLSKKEPGVPLSQTLAEDAKALWDEGLAAEQIAAQLGCSSVIAVEAVDHWFSTRNQSLPNHAERQVALMDRLVVWYDQDLPLNEMAAKVGVNALVVRYLLRERLQQLGRTMVDGRKRIVKK